MAARSILRFLLTLWITGTLSTPILLGQPPAAAEQQFGIPETDEGLPGVGPIRRYDWFRNLWQRRRSDWATRVEQDRGAVVFLGNSITQGWGDDLGGSFGDLKVANRGISGDTTRGMLLRLDEDVLSLKPAGMVLLMGTNDLEEKATPQQVAANMTAILERLHAHSADMPIILCEVFPSSSQKDRPAEKIKAVNQLYRELAKKFPQVTVLDTWTLFANEQGDAKESEFPDLLHPNEAGYEKWARALRPILATHGFLDTQVQPLVLKDDFKPLFNGKDLSGWCLLPTTEEQRQQRDRWQASSPAAPPWPIVEQRVDLQSELQSPNGRYRAINGRLVVTTPLEGRRIEQLWTTREFPNDFILKLEFRATPNADSGVFLRGKQLQVRDFPLAGPYKELKNFRQGDWNELAGTVHDNVARCLCNGEVLEEAFELPATGPIGLEGDRGQLEFRNLRVQTSP